MLIHDSTFLSYLFSNWRSNPAFYIMKRKYRAGPKHLFHFAHKMGRNPDWSITMIFMQLTTQLIDYHILICIIICYKPIILLSPLIKSDFISIETPWSGVNCHHFISYERPSLQVKRQLHILFLNWLYHNDGGCFKCLLCTGISFMYDNILKIFWKLDSIWLIIQRQIRNK